MFNRMFNRMFNVCSSYDFRDEEALYVKFMKDVTNEVLDRGVYNDR